MDLHKFARERAVARFNEVTGIKPAPEIQLVSTRTEFERPSDFELAVRMLRDNLRQERHAYFLWTNGSWRHANIDDIMCRANVLRKNAGLPQFNGKIAWVQA